MDQQILPTGPPQAQRAPLQPEASGFDTGRPVMAIRNGKPIYYGTPEANQLAMEGLAKVKARYGVNSPQWRKAVDAAAGVLGPSYSGPTLEGRTTPVMPPAGGPPNDIVQPPPGGFPWHQGQPSGTPDPYGGRPQVPVHPQNSNPDLMLYRALHQAMLTKMSPASRNLLAMRHLMRDG